MNLALDFKSNPLVNDNIKDCSNSPVEFTDTGARIKYIRPPRYDSLDSPLWRTLVNINTLWDNVDAEQFANETGMRDIVAFKEQLETVNTWLYDALEIKDKIGVTKSYAWKKGCYDTVKHAIMSAQMFHKRPAGMSSLFNRIQDNKWIYDQLQRQMSSLDTYRTKAKTAEIALDSSIDSIIESQKLAYDNIIESTEQANAMSDYYKVYNYIEPADNYTDIKLYTIVHCKAKDMTIINNNNEEICKMKVAECYLKFHRPLYKALNGGRKYPIHYLAAVMNAKHPYINASPYRRISHTTIDRYAWHTLCLSSYTDDITGALYKNDYMSFVMGLMNWNNIYNKDATNPYETITQVMAYGTFADSDTEETTLRLKTALGIHQGDFFRARYSKHVITELHKTQRHWNESITNNVAPYAKYIIEEYDSKNCPTRSSCSGYQRLKSYYESDMQYIAEELVGNFFVNNHSTPNDVSYEIQKMESKLMNKSEVSRDEYINRLFNDLLYEDESTYWNESIKKFESQIEAMQYKIELWEKQLAKYTNRG